MQCAALIRNHTNLSDLNKNNMKDKISVWLRIHNARMYSINCLLTKSTFKTNTNTSDFAGVVVVWSVLFSNIACGSCDIVIVVFYGMTYHFWTFSWNKLAS